MPAHLPLWSLQTCTPINHFPISLHTRTYALSSARLNQQIQPHPPSPSIERTETPHTTSLPTPCCSYLMMHSSAPTSMIAAHSCHTLTLISYTATSHSMLPCHIFLHTASNIPILAYTLPKPCNLSCHLANPLPNTLYVICYPAHPTHPTYSL